MGVEGRSPCRGCPLIMGSGGVPQSILTPPKGGAGASLPRVPIDNGQWGCPPIIPLPPFWLAAVARGVTLTWVLLDLVVFLDSFLVAALLHIEVPTRLVEAYGPGGLVLDVGEQVGDELEHG